MKKILFCLMLSLITLFYINSNINNTKAQSTSTTKNYNFFGLGKTVNIAKDKYLDYIDISSSKSIFDANWLNQRLESSSIVKSPSQFSDSTTISGTSIQNITMDFGLSTKFQTNIDGTYYDVLNTTLKNEFGMASTATINSYKYQFFYKHYGYYLKYCADLSGDENESIYSVNLDKTYQGYLNLLFRDAITPQVFFDKYGTHVITSGVYGGRFDYTYFALNNQKEITANMRMNVEKTITTTIGNKIKSSIGGTFDFKSTIGYDSISIFSKDRMTARGGTSAVVTSLENFSDELNEWLPTLTNENSALIDIPSNGLIPLWELLPPQHKNKKEVFKNKCKQYLTKNTSDFSEYDFDLNLGDKYCDETLHTIRINEEKIDYDNLENNKYDFVDLNLLTEYGFDVLKSAGYDKMKIEIEMEMKEENHGYQYIYLYNNVLNDASYCKGTIEHELGHNVLIKDYTKQTFVFDNINLSDFPNSCLYIKYGSSGKFQNDWFNKNIRIKVTYSR